MTADATHITQLTKADLREIAQMANLEVKLPLRLERSGDGAKLYIEENKLKDMLWSFMSGAGVTMTVARADAGTIPFDAR